MTNVTELTLEAANSLYLTSKSCDSFLAMKRRELLEEMTHSISEEDARISSKIYNARKIASHRLHSLELAASKTGDTSLRDDNDQITDSAVSQIFSDEIIELFSAGNDHYVQISIFELTNDFDVSLLRYSGGFLKKEIELSVNQESIRRVFRECFSLFCDKNGLVKECNDSKIFELYSFLTAEENAYFREKALIVNGVHFKRVSSFIIFLLEMIQSFFVTAEN